MTWFASASPSARFRPWLLVLILVLIKAGADLTGIWSRSLVAQVALATGTSDFEVVRQLWMNQALIRAPVAVLCLLVAVRLADRNRTRTLLLLSMGLWLVCVAGASFLSGPAGLILFHGTLTAALSLGLVAAYLLLVDAFPRVWRPAAVGTYLAFDNLLFFVLVGLGGPPQPGRFGWALLTLAAGLLVLAFVRSGREPPRGASDDLIWQQGPMRLRDRLRALKANVPFLATLTGLAFLYAAIHQFGEVQYYLAEVVPSPEPFFITIALVTLSGLFAGGILGTLIARRSPSRGAPALIPLAAGPIAILMLVSTIFWPGAIPVWAAIGLAIFAINAAVAPAITLSLSEVDPRVRGLAAAIVAIVASTAVAVPLLSQLSSWVRPSLLRPVVENLDFPIMAIDLSSASEIAAGLLRICLHLLLAWLAFLGAWRSIGRRLEEEGW